MQYALFPLRHTWISQGMNGAVSHLDTLAIDFGVLSSHRDYDLYAPFDGHVVFVDSISKGAAVAFQSDKKVKYADGREDYMTLISAHDNTPPNVGQAFKQGEKYSKMGTAGNVGRHSHIEVQVGAFRKWDKYTRQGYYRWPNTIEPYKALWLVKGTEINEKASVAIYPWRYLPEPTVPVEFDSARNQIKVLAMNLRVRTEPSLNGQILGSVNEGDIFNTYEFTGDSLYTWYRIADDQWVADKKGLWCEFMPNEYEEEINKLKEENQKLISMYNSLKEDYDRMVKSRNANKEKKEEYKTLLKKVKKYTDKASELIGGAL